MALATLHCLTGCAIGEILRLVIGTAAGLSAGWTIALAVLFGCILSTLPLLKAGLGIAAALSAALAADTLSIAIMELVGNTGATILPMAYDEGLVAR